MKDALCRAWSPVCLGLAIVLAASFGVRPPTAPAAAFSLLGHSLAVDARDVRVQASSFLDATAHDNTVAHPAFPGSTGVSLAIRKAHAEWGSLPRAGHGLGDGLASNPVLGSGASNYDATWQGEVEVAATDGNVHRAAVCGGGVLAFAQTGPGGWSITYCESIAWDDGPGLPDPGAFDLQAIATTEIGHVLGLGHSAAPGATMSPAVFGDATSLRSIEADDIAGLQAIYGAISATRPRLDAVAGSDVTGGTLVLSGANFHPFANEVWFTDAAATGDPLVVGGVPSSAGGSEISVTIPVGAAPGDVLVKVPGSGHDALSNPWPLDVDGPPGDFVLTGPALAGSVGELPLLSGVGDLSPGSASGFALHLQLVTPFAPGVLFFGIGEGDVPFKGGTFDPVPIVAEVPVSVGASGRLDLPVAVPAGFPGGVSLWLQAWFADASGPLGATGTNGLRLDLP